MSPEELQVAIAFARLELLELEHGRRTVTQCAGIESIAKEAARVRAELRRPLPQVFECECGKQHPMNYTCTMLGFKS